MDSAMYIQVLVVSAMLSTGFAQLKTCPEVYSSATDTPSSGSYTLLNANGAPFTVYCLFKSGYGYTFISSSISVDPNLAELFTEKTEVLLRHKRQNGQQYDATVAKISRYSSRNLGVFYNSFSGYNELRNGQITPYLYVGFVPIADMGVYPDTQGWKVQGADYTFINCDSNPNSYFALLFNSENQSYLTKPPSTSVMVRAWYNYASAANTADYIPDSFFSNQFEIHFGGCGGYQTSTHFSDVAGVSIGLRFTLSICFTPGTITSGSRSISGTNPADTVTYSCNAGYIITSGDATRTCIGGRWSGTQPTCEDIDECASNPCKNGATCINGQNMFSCTCASGWSGTTCQTDIDECASNPCKNGATCINGQNMFSCTCASVWSGTTCQTGYQCTANNDIQVFGFSAGTNFYAMQGADECTVTSLNATAIQISNCQKDEVVLLTYGSYSGMETHGLHGGKTVNAVNITCSEIPDAGNTHNINNTFAASLSIDGSQTIDPTYDVTSSLSSASVVVGDEVTWTIDFPAQYILQVTECRAYPGIDASSSIDVTLISMGGCLVSSQLISNFTDNLNGTATATIEAFKFFSSENVFLACDLKICPNNSAQCDTFCTRTKREVDIFKRSAADGDDELGFYPGRIHNVLTVIDPYGSMALTITPFGWRFMLTLAFVHFISIGKGLLTSV